MLRRASYLRQQVSGHRPGPSGAGRCTLRSARVVTPRLNPVARPVAVGLRHNRLVRAAGPATRPDGRSRRRTAVRSPVGNGTGRRVAARARRLEPRLALRRGAAGRGRLSRHRLGRTRVRPFGQAVRRRLLAGGAPAPARTRAGRTRRRRADPDRPQPRRGARPALCVCPSGTHEGAVPDRPRGLPGRCDRRPLAVGRAAARRDRARRVVDRDAGRPGAGAELHRSRTDSGGPAAPVPARGASRGCDRRTDRAGTPVDPGRRRGLGSGAPLGSGAVPGALGRTGRAGAVGPGAKARARPPACPARAAAELAHSPQLERPGAVLDHLLPFLDAQHGKPDRGP